MISLMEKAKIRLWLGYPDIYRDHHTRLESILTSVSDEAEVQIRECLAKLDNVETLIVESSGNVGLKRVDEIWFQDGKSQITGQMNIGRMYLSRLSIILGVPPYSDPFGKAGFLGNKFSGPPERGGAGWFNIG